MEEVRALWDNQAPAFDDSPDHGLRDPETRAAWKKLLHDWMPDPSLHVLDSGCGTGSLSVLLAELGHQVTGIDISPAMIARARSKATEHVVSIELLVMDAAFPQFPPYSFDAIVCRHLLWTLTDPHSVLERWSALLKPQGVLVLIEGFWHTGAGLTAQQIVSALPARMTTVQVHNLSKQPVLWGSEVSDERYAVIARAAL
ncbi:MAG: class I SAM-dependent methyltransferase [Chloroflexi bacterium]|nr:class I SAM-dependent methyltransferase [Chloroflexota bacterium]